MTRSTMLNPYTTGTYGIDSLAIDSFHNRPAQLSNRSYSHTRTNPRNDPIAGRQHQVHSCSISNSAQVQNDSTGGSHHRRRIPVACGRCRKRKIRCSGDPGDNSGCKNCRSASVANECVFLRVSSSHLDLSPSYSSSAPALSSSPHGVGIGMHPQGSFSTPSLASTLSHQSMRISPYNANSTAVMDNKLYACNPASLGHNAIYDHVSSMNFGSRSIYDGIGNDASGSGDNNYHYMIHSTSEPGSSLAEPSPAVLPSQSEFPRHWNGAPHHTNGKTASTGYYNLEQEAVPGSIGNISNFMPSSSTRALHSMDSFPNVHMFPALGQLSNMLPESGARPPLSDKALPPLPHSRAPTSIDLGLNMKPYGTYTDSSGNSGASQSRGSTSTRRSPATNYIPSSSSMHIMQHPSSERSTPILSGTGSTSHYITSSVGLGGSGYSQQPLLSSSIDQLSGSGLLKPERQHADPDFTLQSTPRSSAHIPALLRSTSGSSSSSYHNSGDQNRGMGLGKVYS